MLVFLCLGLVILDYDAYVFLRVNIWFCPCGVDIPFSSFCCSSVDPGNVVAVGFL